MRSTASWHLLECENTSFCQVCDQDSLLERAITTGWKCYWEGERDVDELIAAAVEAIEGDVTDHVMCKFLIQMIQELFDQAVFPVPTATVARKTARAEKAGGTEHCQGRVDW